METHTSNRHRSDTPPATANRVELVVNAPAFDNWAGLLGLLRSSFSYTQGLVVPPSTVFDTTESDLRRRAENETLLLGLVKDRPIACLFVKELPDKLFLGRFAIAPPYRGRGLARKMIGIAETRARALNLSVLELETRVNLIENQSKFRALGFEICGGRAHQGYSYQTTLILRKNIVQF